MLAVFLIVAQAGVGPASAATDPSTRAPKADRAPDFGSATLVESNSDYEITDDGYLIYEGDMVFECRALRYEEGTSLEAHKERIRICTEAGFPLKEALPETGGLPG